jgi:hypothetical protein
MIFITDSELPTVLCAYRLSARLKGNGPVGQVRTSHEILLVYRGHLEMTVHKISAVYTMCKGVQKTAQGLNAQLEFKHHDSEPCDGVKHYTLFLSIMGNT